MRVGVAGTLPQPWTPVGHTLREWQSEEGFHFDEEDIASSSSEDGEEEEDLLEEECGGGCTSPPSAWTMAEEREIITFALQQGDQANQLATSALVAS